MDRSLLLGRMEDQKMISSEQVVVALAPRRRTMTFGRVCYWVLLSIWLNFSSSFFPDRDLTAAHRHLTPAQVAEAGALQIATRWCSAAGAVAMVLAILLEGRRSRSRSRRALACAGLACAAADHYMATRFNGLLVLNSPGYLLSYVVAATAAIYAVLDIAFLALTLGVGEDSEEE